MVSMRRRQFITLLGGAGSRLPACGARAARSANAADQLAPVGGRRLASRVGVSLEALLIVMKGRPPAQVHRARLALVIPGIGPGAVTAVADERSRRSSWLIVVAIDPSLPPSPSTPEHQPADLRQR
jgi:hypothetical protein